MTTRASIEQSEVAVFVPTYNEIDSLSEIIKRTRAAAPLVLIVIVDDASPDGTGALADSLARVDNNMLVIHRSKKMGLGTAYRAAFQEVMTERPEIAALVSMDADGSHDPADLPRLLEQLQNADVVLGSRWVPGGSVVNWPRWREVLSKGGNIYTRALLGIDLGDGTGGFRAYRRAALAAIEFASTNSEGYCFQVEMVVRALKRGLKVVEIPITFTERVDGVSKMSNAIVVEAFGRIGWWGIKGALGRRPFESA